MALEQFYDSRASTYDDTWHRSFTARFVTYLDIRPGQHVLDLACGTGLLSFLEADATGETGRVVGVDATPSMLARAQSKHREEYQKYRHVEFYQGDVLDLASIQALKGQSFDIITLSSALVLLPNPKAAVSYWTTFLKPGGLIAMDATHPRNLISGMVLEKTGLRLGQPVPYNRSWSQSEDSLREVLELAGLEVQQVVTVDNQAGYGRRHYDVSEGEDLFVNSVLTGSAAALLAKKEIRQEALRIFKEEWEKLAVDGKVEEVDAVFLGIARKPSQSQDAEIAFSGGCRCGGVRYTSSTPLPDVTICHCQACQQLSGSAFLPFTQVPTSCVTYTSIATLQGLKLSDAAERTLCRKCGSPITMIYTDSPRTTSLTLGSVNNDTLRGNTPVVKQHIYLREKVPWMWLPESNGVEMHETMPGGREIIPYPVAER